MLDNSHGWICLRDIPVDARVGIYAHEHGRLQGVVLSVGLWLDTAKAAHSGNIADTVDWADVSRRLIDTARAQHYGLIETLAETLASMLLERFKVEKVRVEVQKPESLAVGIASVAIERGKV